MDAVEEARSPADDERRRQPVADERLGLVLRRRSRRRARSDGDDRRHRSRDCPSLVHVIPPALLPSRPPARLARTVTAKLIPPDRLAFEARQRAQPRASAGSTCEGAPSARRPMVVALIIVAVLSREDTDDDPGGTIQLRQAAGRPDNAASTTGDVRRLADFRQDELARYVATHCPSCPAGCRAAHRALSRSTCGSAGTTIRHGGGSARRDGPSVAVHLLASFDLRSPISLTCASPGRPTSASALVYLRIVARLLQPATRIRPTSLLPRANQRQAKALRRAWAEVGRGSGAGTPPTPSSTDSGSATGPACLGAPLAQPAPEAGDGSVRQRHPPCPFLRHPARQHARGQIHIGHLQT